MTRMSGLIAILRFLRLEQALPAVSNSWLMVYLAFDLETGSSRNASLTQYGSWSLWVCLLLGAAVSTGMSVYALGINDLLDLRHDRTFQPHRLLASGKMNVTAALVLALVSLAVGMTAAVLLGRESALLAVTAAMGLLFYNTMGKYLPAVGIVALGLIWALNMLIVNPRAGFIWPVWLNMSHVMIAATMVHLLEGKRPRLRLMDFAGILAGWLFWTLAMFSFMNLRDLTTSYETQWVWIGPGAAAAIYLALCFVTLRPISKQPDRRPAATRQYAAVALLSLILFDAGWLAALGYWGQACCVLGLLLLAAGSRWTLHLLDQLAAPELRYRVSGDG